MKKVRGTKKSKVGAAAGKKVCLVCFSKDSFVFYHLLTAHVIIASFRVQSQILHVLCRRYAILMNFYLFNSVKTFTFLFRVL